MPKEGRVLCKKGTLSLTVRHPSRNIKQASGFSREDKQKPDCSGPKDKCDESRGNQNAQGVWRQRAEGKLKTAGEGGREGGRVKGWLLRMEKTVVCLIQAGKASKERNTMVMW